MTLPRCAIFTRVANFCRKVLSREESEAEQAVARPHMTIIPREQHAISRKDISENALKVLYRLNKAGYEAYGRRRRPRSLLGKSRRIST